MPGGSPKRGRFVAQLENHCFEGFRYVHNRFYKETQYIVCVKNRSKDCEGRGKIVRGEFIATHPHRCGDPDPHARAVEMFRKELKAALKFKRPPREVYNEVALRHPDIAMHVTYQSVKRSMMNWKGKWLISYTGLKKFDSLEELGNFLKLKKEELFTYSHGSLDCEIVKTGNTTSLILCNKQFVAKFKATKMLHIDATFRVYPRIGINKSRKNQLLIVMANLHGCAFPIMWVLMEGRTEAEYTAVFNIALATFAGYTGNVMCDFEVALRESLRAVLPGAHVLGCLFHFSQAIHKMAKKHGILQKSRDDEEMRFFLRKIVALALLPAEMVSRAFCDLCASAPTEFLNLFDPLLLYFDNYWLQTRTPADFSVYRQLVRTNNVAESNNSRMSKYLSKRPSAMTFCVAIYEIQRLASIELISAQNGYEVRSRRFKYMADNDSLLYAWDSLKEESPSTTMIFLSRGARAIHKFPRVTDIELSEEEIEEAEEDSDDITMGVENTSDTEDTMDSEPLSPEPLTVPAAVQPTPAVPPSSILPLPIENHLKIPKPVVTAGGHPPLIPTTLTDARSPVPTSTASSLRLHPTPVSIIRQGPAVEVPPNAPEIPQTRSCPAAETAVRTRGSDSTAMSFNEWLFRKMKKK